MEYLALYPGQQAPSIEGAKAVHCGEFYRQPHNRMLARTAVLASIGIDGVTLSPCERFGERGYVYTEEMKRVVFEVARETGDFEIIVQSGYQYWLSRDCTRVAVEAYSSCAGNLCVIVHRRDGDLVYVSGRRHGIVGLAQDYRNEKPKAVLAYITNAPDASPWDAGVTPADAI